MANEVKDKNAASLVRDSIGTMGNVLRSGGTPADKQKAFVKQRLAEAGVRITEQMDASIDKIFANANGLEDLATKEILKLIQNQASKRQDLQVEQARTMMSLLSTTEQSKMNIASMAQSFATFARFIGADQFADYVESKVEEIKSSVKIPLDVSKIQDGQTEMNEGLKNVLGIVQAAPGARAATKGANAYLNGTKDQVPQTIDLMADAPGSPSLATSGRKVVTWSSLEQAAKSAGLNKEGMASLQKAFDLTKEMTPTGDNASVDTEPEKLMLIRQIGKELTGPNGKAVDKLKEFINDPNAPAPRLK